MTFKEKFKIWLNGVKNLILFGVPAGLLLYLCIKFSRIFWAIIGILLLIVAIYVGIIYFPYMIGKELKKK